MGSTLLPRAGCLHHSWGSLCRRHRGEFRIGPGVGIRALPARLARHVDLRAAGPRPKPQKAIHYRLVQKLWPGQVAAGGLGAAAMLEANPLLVYASIGAFGAAGPLPEEPGYDPLMQAFGGLMSMTGEAGRPPVRVGTLPIDTGAGMWVVTGVLAALLRRASTGRDGEVATSLYETTLSWMLYHVVVKAATGEKSGQHGSGTAMIAPDQAFPTANGELVVAAGNGGLFRRLCGVAGLPELAEEPRYATKADRVRYCVALTEALGEVLRKCSRAY